MAKRACLMLVAGLASATSARAQEQVPAPERTIGEALKDAAPGSAARACKSSDPTEVVVCGHSATRYRIDPSVLASTRAVEAKPPKPLLDASTEQSCVGPDCGGATIPLVGMALVALKAAELAAQGDDWREAFRTRPDAYQVYEDAKAKEAKRPRVSVGVSAGNRK
jgi:hypothetical protein